LPKEVSEGMYKEIEENKRNSVILMLVFVVIISGMGWVFGEIYDTFYIPSFMIILSILWSLGAYFVGDRIILKMSGAKEIQPKKHPKHKYIDNVVEGLSIAAGIPKPKIYLIDDSAINAFATGRDPKHSSITFTTGALSRLDRDELEGVAAHEISHIQNFDIRFSMMVTVMVGIITLLADMFLRIRFKRDDDAPALLVVLGLVLSLIAPLFARLIQFAISRQREYLADASAVKLTRYPLGLAEALEKIGNDKEPLEAANRATSHMYIADPFKSGWTKKLSNAFSTHPPLPERVKRLRAMKGH
jgi:heat shock protein HtpX